MSLIFPSSGVLCALYHLQIVTCSPATLLRDELVQHGLAMLAAASYLRHQGLLVSWHHSGLPFLLRLSARAGAIGAADSIPGRARKGGEKLGMAWDSKVH